MKVKLDTGTILRLGDSTLLKPVQVSPSNVVFDWKPITNLHCANCPETWARPFVATTYVLTVKDPSSQCEQRDSVKIGVNNPKTIPIVMNGRTDFIAQRAAGHIKKVISLEIYTVLGQLIYRVENIGVNDPALDWLESGVNNEGLSIFFLYRIKVEYLDGSTSGFYTGKGFSWR